MRWNLLAGTTLEENLLPGTLESLPEQMISLVPAGVSSDGSAASPGYPGSGT